MESWLWLPLAGVLCAGAGAGGARYADYSAVQMPQYEAINYDSPVSTSSDETYRDRDAPADVSVPIDYNDYDQTNDRRRLKNPKGEDSFQPSNKIGKRSTTVVADYADSDYNYKSEKISPRMKYSKNRPKNFNLNKIKENELVKLKSKSMRNANVIQQTPLDDEDTEIPSKQFEEGEDLSSDRDRSKFVRRDIRPKVRQNSWEQRTTGIRLSDPDYDDNNDVKLTKNSLKVGSSDYIDTEMAQQGPNPNRLSRPSSRPQGDNPPDDVEESQAQPPGRHRAPLPKYRKPSNEYVDYNDMSRIEKIKNLSARRTTGTESSLAGNGNVAEQLKAALGRKETPPALPYVTMVTSNEALPTLTLDSVDPYQEKQWYQFLIQYNHTTRHQHWGKRADGSPDG